jgi:hypothetical protein
MMFAKPIHNTAALMLKLGKERVLVVTDLHLGIEGEMALKGVSLPSQIPRTKDKLTQLLEKRKPDRLIMLGDVKHNVPVASWQEWRELPGFFEDISKIVSVEIVPGNHDGDIAGMVPKSVKINDARGVLLGKRKLVGLLHGHAWPSPELMKAELLVIGHNHPAVEFRDELGGRTVEPIWLKAKLRKEKLPKKLQMHVKEGPPELLVMPAFGELVMGAPVNRRMPEELIGPIFRSGAVKLEEAEVYLLDGTFLGTVGESRKLLNREKIPYILV